MKKIRLTIAEFREIRKLKSQVEANAIMSFLKKKGVAIEVGRKKNKDGRGKPAVLYELPQKAVFELFTDEEMPKEFISETEKVSSKQELTTI
jgi:predicted transcriptional regulator